MTKRLMAGLAFSCALVGLLAAPASAGSITFNLDTEFSGGTPPVGSTPWVTATFEDLLGGGVQLTITALNLTGNEFISAFYFNFNPSLNSALYLGTVPGTGTQTLWNSRGAGNEAWKADGDGFFDFYVDFPPPPGDADSKFTAGETFIWTWNAALGLTAADFDFASVDGPVGKTGFYAAAHVQAIGSEDDSGWIGASAGGTAVPEPSSLVLLCAGIGLLGAARWRTKA